jgi:hypothetical protein
MEYIIILVLIIFLLILIFKKQLHFLKDSTINSTIDSTKIKTNKLNIIKYNNVILLNNNPILLYLYENLYISLKKCNRYNYKKYIVFNNINLSERDKSILDWISYTGGIINMAYDSSIKNIKQKKMINDKLINNIAKLKLFYKLVYRLDENKMEKVIKTKKYNKYNKYIKSNRFIYNLVYINEVLIKIYNNIIKTISKNNIKKILNKNKNNYYLCNIFLNNKSNCKKKNYESKFNKYIIL